jgi:endonuclease YncB( thermonuclease family)
MLTIIKKFFYILSIFLISTRLTYAETPKDNLIIGIPSKVISGDTIVIDNHLIKLYNIISLTPTQECIDKEIGRYTCGNVAKNVLKDITRNNNIVCSVLSWSDKGAKISQCNIEKSKIDLSLYMLKSGWSLVKWFDRDLNKNLIKCSMENCEKIDDIFIEFEKDAVKNKRGIWSSKFDLPWLLY